MPLTGDAVGHMVEMCHPGAVAYEVRYSGFLVAVRSRAEVGDVLKSSVGDGNGGEGKGGDRLATMRLAGTMEAENSPGGGTHDEGQQGGNGATVEHVTGCNA